MVQIGFAFRGNNTAQRCSTYNIQTSNDTRSLSLRRESVSCRCRSGQVDCKPIIQYQPKSKSAAPAPEEVPITHSSAFLLNRSKPLKEKTTVVPTTGTSGSTSQSAVDWALQQADAYFDKVEADDDTHSTARVIVKNPATQATLKTMQGVTVLGATAAPHIAKAAVPVGKKILSVSAGALVAGVSALTDAAKKKKSQQDKR